MADAASGYSDFGYGSTEPLCSHRYLLPVVLEMLAPLLPGMRVLDVGCGNGSMAGELISTGARSSGST